MRRYTMQDMSAEIVNRTDKDLSLQQVLEMTDYSELEVDNIACMSPGDQILIGSSQDISIARTDSL